MSFVNCALLPVPVKNREDYIETARQMAGFFKSKGAIRCVECWGVDIPEGQLTSMPMAVAKKDDEAIVMAWIEWPSKEHSDRAFGEMMEGGNEMGDMPFDGNRMIFGGFEKILDL